MIFSACQQCNLWLAGRLQEGFRRVDCLHQLVLAYLNLSRYTRAKARGWVVTYSAAAGM